MIAITVITPSNRELPMKTLRIYLPFLAVLSMLGPGKGYASEFNLQVPMHSKGATTYYVSGFINGSIASDFLVDTGSGYVTINTQTLKLLKREGSAEFVKKISAIMADGSETVVPVYRIATLKLGDSCIIQNVEAAVMPGSAPNILGLSALKKAAPFALTITPPTLRLTGCGTASI